MGFFNELEGISSLSSCGSGSSSVVVVTITIIIIYLFLTILNQTFQYLKTINMIKAARDGHNVQIPHKHMNAPVVCTCGFLFFSYGTWLSPPIYEMLKGYAAQIPQASWLVWVLRSKYNSSFIGPHHSSYELQGVMVRDPGHQMGLSLQIQYWYYVPDQNMTFQTQGSHTSQMRKFKGISRVIKGSTAYFKGTFGKLL